MMSFNVTWFGYGCGLVLCGWLAGMIVSVVLGIVGKMGKLGLVLAVGAGILLGSCRSCRSGGAVGQRRY